ncbi:MAG: DUF2917 domain-containing protein [Thiomonas sp.]|uniref:DUF2917 domain-containing protein n=1 Tax=Thiomonas arsenitoxydans (strain DSM 22701 / CIP 110005 / 3As) TaxID=426114 RepID=A0A8I1SVN7_THIA3|nr:MULTISPECIES: DUF2917 domain-containing protein [Thiomonas]MBN8744472.1 DUF2917 domain-containing protein [Thiomonas arsenitoxydans]MDE2270173.1 DUF2917 domain-containing protein [Betaproteobacteria bacterium]ODU97036.1 MAG: hypothetical protein ABT24_07055 [Thiomonas sp. SCN 64-16]
MPQTEVSIQRDWILLQPGDLLTLRNAAGQSVRLESAQTLASQPGPVRVWLTEEGQPDDVFLHPGDGYTVRGSGRVVLTVWCGTARLRLGNCDRVASSPHTAMPSSRSIQSASAWATACGASAMRL